MREIILDLETTGLNPNDGHRVVEIACLELRNYVPTGHQLRHYLDPERDMPEDAFRIHGLSQDFLSGKPRFAEVADEILQFIGDAPLVIHNAEFDMGFLNAELSLLGYPALPLARAIDTLHLARRQFPGLPNSLDALCKRYHIDLSGREKHGALLDCELLAAVYLELRGGRQAGLGFAAAGQPSSHPGGIPQTRAVRPARPHAPSPAEWEAHRRLLAQLQNPLWLSTEG